MKITAKNLPRTGKSMLDEIKATLKKYDVWDDNTPLEVYTPKLKVMMHLNAGNPPCQWVDKSEWNPITGKYEITSVCV